MKINQAAHLSLSAPSSPSSLSAVTPPLSPSVASPPPRRLSLKRFSLFSRFPGKHSHGPEEGGGRREEGGGREFLFKPLLSHHLPPFFFFLHHLQSPDPASPGPECVHTVGNTSRLCAFLKFTLLFASLFKLFEKTFEPP